MAQTDSPERAPQSWAQVRDMLKARRIPLRWLAVYSGVPQGAIYIVAKRDSDIARPDPDAILRFIRAVEGGWRPS